MSRLTRDGTAEPVSGEQVLRRRREQGSINFPCLADHEQDWQHYYPVDLYFAMYVMIIQMTETIPLFYLWQPDPVSSS